MDKKIVLEFGNPKHIKLRDEGRREWLFNHIFYDGVRDAAIKNIVDDMSKQVKRCVKCYAVHRCVECESIYCDSIDPHDIFKVAIINVKEETEELGWLIHCKFFQNCKIRLDRDWVEPNSSFLRECGCDCERYITTNFEGDLIE